MYRCINHCFQYCTKPSERSTQYVIQPFRGLGGESYDQSVPITVCPHAWSTCAHRLTFEDSRVPVVSFD